MTFNRVLRLPKPPTIHSLQSGLPKSTRWCSSSPSSGAQKPPNSKQQRALGTMEGSDNKCVERDSGSFLDPINFQTEVGKSWLTLKGIFTDLRAKMIGAPQSQKQNTVKMISSAVDDTVSEAIKTKDSPQDSEIGQPNHSIPMPNVITDSQSRKQNISTSLRSDVVGESSLSDVVDATASNQVVVTKSLDSTGPSEARDTTKSSADVVFPPENLVAAIVSEVRKESSSEIKSTSETLHIMRKSSMGSSAGQLTLQWSNGKKVHSGRHKDVDHGYIKSLVHTLEGFVNSHNNEKRVTETAASNMIRKRSYKVEGQSGLKPESHRQLELGVSGSEFGFLSSLTHQLPGETSRILQKDIGHASTLIGNGNPQPGKRMTSSSGIPQQVRGLADMFVKTMNGQRADVITSKKSDAVASNGVLDLSNEANDKTCQVNSLIGCTKGMPTEASTITPQNCTTPNNSGLVKSS